MTIRAASYQEDGHLYSENGLIVPSVTQVCQSVGLYSLDGIPNGVREFKADLRTEVHAVTALLDRGENLDEYDIDPRILPYVDSYREFKAAQKWTVSLVEYGPFIADVGSMPVGFRLDRVGVLNGGENIAEL